MNKGARTKFRIIEQTSGLFNTKGYYTTTLSDIMHVTGLKKGGLYNHFASKEELALQVFNYNTMKMSERFAQAVAGQKTCLDKLTALFRVSLDVYKGNPIQGGCPILNAGVEADDYYPPLRTAARKGLQRMKNIFSKLLEKGLKEGELAENINIPEMTAFFISSLEGGLFISKLEGNDEPLKVVIKNLELLLHSMKKQ